ncbi:MAG: hypothetical protein Q8M03_09005 [Legionella sp.]|nr:hypothetical protein [Legionella sp.]
MVNIRVLVLFFLMIISHGALAELFPHEEIMQAQGAEALVYFEKGESNKPLVLFIPGDSHLARISYGYPEGRPQDFLSFWLHKKGYSFAGISYPTDNPVFSKVYPGFTIKDWGEQAAEIADKLIQRHHLSKKIIVLGWSMGGSIEVRLNAAAKKRGISVEAFIGLAAVPPLPSVMQTGAFDTNKILPNHLADRRSLVDVFLKMINVQNSMNEHVIIPPEIYKTRFLANIPTALSAEGYRYENGKFVYNVDDTLRDGEVYNFKDTPWIALIEDDSPTTAKISLFDPACWNFLRSEMIFHTLFSKRDLTRLSKTSWTKLIQLINELPHHLKVTVSGNHFFFLGEKGARATADQIEVLIFRLNKIKQELFAISNETLVETVH